MGQSAVISQGQFTSIALASSVLSLILRCWSYCRLQGPSPDNAGLYGLHPAILRRGDPLESRQLVLVTQHHRSMYVIDLCRKASIWDREIVGLTNFVQRSWIFRPPNDCAFTFRHCPLPILRPVTHSAPSDCSMDLCHIYLVLCHSTTYQVEVRQSRFERYARDTAKCKPPRPRSRPGDGTRY